MPEHAWWVLFVMGELGYFPLYQRFQKFQWEFKWKGPFRFLLTGMFGITFEGGPHNYFSWNIPIEMRCSTFGKPVLCPNLGIQKNNLKWQEPFLLVGPINRKMSFHFPLVFPLISDWSLWHNGSTQLRTSPHTL